MLEKTLAEWSDRFRYTRIRGSPSPDSFSSGFPYEPLARRPTWRPTTTLRRVIFLASVLFGLQEFRLFIGPSSTISSQTANYLQAFGNTTHSTKRYPESSNWWLLQTPPRHSESMADAHTRALEALGGMSAIEKLYQQDNLRVLTELLACKMENKCTLLQRSVVLLRCDHFANVKNGLFNRAAVGTAGEAIWADSFMWALEQLGYPYLVFSSGAFRGARSSESANALTAQVYQLLADEVKLVVSDYLTLPDCLKQPDCIQTDSFPTGIPLWKQFVFNAFSTLNGGHRYGAPFALTFFPPPVAQASLNFTFLGLSMEHMCDRHSFVPHEKRNQEALILGKFRSYFASQIWPDEFWAQASQETGIKFVVGTTSKKEERLGENFTIPLAPGIIDVGTTPRTEYLNRLSQSRVLVGIGEPWLSSSPLEALCLGVPFLNPIKYRPSGAASGDRNQWSTQHLFLQMYDEPFVYNVPQGDYRAFVRALNQAIKQPIERWVPDLLTTTAYFNRVEAIINRDWKALADELEATGKVREPLKQ